MNIRHLITLCAIVSASTTSLAHAGQTCCKMPTPSVTPSSSTSSFILTSPPTPRPVVTPPPRPQVPSTSLPSTPTTPNKYMNLPHSYTY